MSPQPSSPEKIQHWADTLAAQRQSKLSVRAFCQSHCISEPSFHYWKRRFKHNPPAPRQPDNPSPELVEISLPPDSMPSGCDIEITLADPPIVRIHGEVSSEQLQRILTTTRQSLC
jgi:hypothetical protein